MVNVVRLMFPSRSTLSRCEFPKAIVSDAKGVRALNCSSETYSSSSQSLVHLRQLRTQQGFSLLEVSIASLVFAIGLLGVAAMQRLNAQQAKHNYWQAQALQLASDYRERIKSNYIESNTGQYLLTGSVSDPGYDCIFNYGDNDLDTACTSAQIAQVDRYTFSTAVERSLPSGEVQASLAPNGVYAITIAWVDPASGDSYEFRSQFLP